VNVSRRPEFAITLSDTTQTEYSSQATTSSDWTIGGSVAVSAKETFTLGVPLIGETKVTGQQQAKFQDSYDEKQSEYNSTSSSYTFTIQRSTSDDDLVSGSIRDLTIWRYPVLGFTTTDDSGTSLTPFYEIELPGAVVQIAPSGGKNFDWYQPQHENGNLLSYPPLAGGLVNIPDLGEYQLPGDSAPKQQALLNETYFVDPDAGTFALELDSSAGGGSEKDTTKQLAESLDVSLSAETTVAGFGLETTVDTAINNSNSWSNVSVSDHKTSSANSFSMAIPAGLLDASQAYEAGTAYYFATDGTQKVVHGVDLTASASGRDFWTQSYGGRPDPGLNLPQKIIIVTDPVNGQQVDPNWTNTPVRQQLRGFFVLHGSKPSNPGEANAPVARAITDGEPVQFQVRVYNYSLDTAVNSVEVAFWAVPMDDEFRSNTGAPIPICQVGSTCPHTTISPLGMQPVTVPWDTTGRGPSTPGSGQNYRIFVVLDPNNEISNEIHEWQDRFDCPPTVEGGVCNGGGERLIDPLTGAEEVLETGQNNQGFGEFTVQAKATSARLAASAQLRSAKASQGLAAVGPDVHLKSHSVAARDRIGRIKSGAVMAVMDQPLQIRVSVYTDAHSLRQHHVLVYEGQPAEGGRLIAAKVLHGIDLEGAHVWVDWVPRAPGHYRIWARALEKGDDSQPGNDKGVLHVWVREPRTIRRNAKQP
jgi:hypothetical protein